MITVCAEMSSFQFVDDSSGMQGRTTQAQLCHSTKHLLYPSQRRLETVLTLPPSCLSEKRGRRFIITGCKTIQSPCSQTHHFHPAFYSHFSFQHTCLLHETDDTKVHRSQEVVVYLRINCWHWHMRMCGWAHVHFLSRPFCKCLHFRLYTCVWTSACTFMSCHDE